jgi:hypothetical protein
MALPENDTNNIANEPCWKDPNIVGVLLRNTWYNIQKTNATTYDWSYFVQGLQLCQQYGKFAMLEVSAGNNCPPWVKTYKGLNTFLLDAVSTPGGIKPACYIPPPWDPVFQSLWGTFVAVFGAKFDQNPLVLGVTMWSGGRDEEAFFAQTQGDVTRLDNYVNPANGVKGLQNWIDGMHWDIDQYASFPTTMRYLATGVDYANDSGVSMTQVARYAIATWGNSIQSNGFSPNFPQPNTYFPHTNLALDGPLMGPYTGYQFAAAVPPTGPSWMGTLSACVDNALAANAIWIQCYPTDPATDPGEASLIRFNQAVESFL